MMEVRKASAFDMPFLLEMLRAYREATPLEFLAEADDAAYVTIMLSELIAGKGLILVAVDDGGICGMLIAGIGPSIWSPKHLLMKEFAYWVNEESRYTSAGLRLLAAYKAYGEALKAEGRIANFLISKMVNSPDLKFDRYGFQKLEEFWVM
jgi:hypothetical protein